MQKNCVRAVLEKLTRPSWIYHMIPPKEGPYTIVDNNSTGEGGIGFDDLEWWGQHEQVPLVLVLYLLYH